MALEGSLRDFGLADILQLIYFQKKSGVLTLTGRGSRIKLLFSEGNITATESKGRSEDERTGRILLKKGLLQEVDLRVCLEEQKMRDVRIGDLLLKKGLVRQEELRETLVAQIIETVAQLFSWKEGTYEFEVQPVPAGREFSVSVDTQHILMDGLRIMDEWSLAGGKITIDTVFRKTGKGEAPTAREETLLCFIDGENDVSLLISLSGMADFEATKTLLSLMDRGIIEVVPAVPVAAERIAPAVERGKRVFSLSGLLSPLVCTVFLLVSLFVSLALSGRSGVFGGMLFTGDDYRRTKTERQIEQLQIKADMYRYRHGSYPVTLQEIGRTKDAWGRPFAYSPGDGPAMIVSAGPDGKMETPDDIF